MERLEMLRQAQRLAIETLDGVACLNDAEFAELRKLPKQKAIEEKAHRLLNDAADEVLSSD